MSASVEPVSACRASSAASPRAWASTPAAVGLSAARSAADSAVAPVTGAAAAVRVPRARSASRTTDWLPVTASTSSMTAIGALSPLRGPSLVMRV